MTQMVDYLALACQAVLKGCACEPGLSPAKILSPDPADVCPGRRQVAVPVLGPLLYSGRPGLTLAPGLLSPITNCCGYLTND